VAELQKHTVESHVRRMLDLYDKHLPTIGETTDLALMLTTVVNGVARAMADALNDPGLQPLMVKEIWRLHGPAIAQKLASAVAGPGEPAKVVSALKQARHLAGENPVALYVAGRLRLEDAVWRLGVRAHKAGLPIGELFYLLANQYQLELGAHTLEHVKAAEMAQDPNASGAFYLQHLSGGINAADFEASVKRSGSTPTWSLGSLDLVATSPIASRLDELVAALALWDPANVADVGTPAPRNKKTIDDAFAAAQAAAAPSAQDVAGRGETRERFKKTGKKLKTSKPGARLRHSTSITPPPGTEGGLSERQYGLIRGVGMEDAAERPTRQAVVAAYLQTRYGISANEARSVLERCERWWRTVPLTVSVKAADFFPTAAGPAWGTKYKPTAALGKRLAVDPAKGRDRREEVLGSGRGTNFSYVENTNASRGENYLRWRRDKDAEETRLRGLSDDESANFGAANVNFATTKGFEGGIYYGETHLLLKDALRSRTLFNFNTTRMLRSDVVSVLHDIVTETQRANYAGVRAPAVKASFVDAIVAQSLGTGHTFFTPNLQVEAEVFGDVDLSRDLQAIAIPKTAFSLAGARTGTRDQTLDDTLRKNVKAFCRANSIKLIEYDPGTWKTVVLGSEVLQPAFKTAIQQAL
jgi:hypothetical protein